jgi:uncharacterized repeat protein (TIGR01451 family)
MTTGNKLLATVSLFATVLAATPSWASGTPAGSTITNNVTVDYKVGGVSQTQIEASDSFTVDRKVNLMVAESGSSTTNVSPGQEGAVTTFVVTNTSNAPADFALTAANRANSTTAAHSGSDNFDVTDIKIHADTNANGTFESETDLEITYLDQVAADASRTVFVVANIPVGRTNTDVAGVRLTATSHEATAASSLGTAVTQTSGANTAGVDTVFADTNSGGNTANDGIHFAEDDYTIAAASLSVTKTSKIISDPINSSTNPKMIPGAVVEYCVIVANAADSTTATNVSISDTLPEETTYLSSFGILLNGTYADGACDDDGDAGGNHSDGTIAATLSDIAAGVTRTVLFRVTVN